MDTLHSLSLGDLGIGFVLTHEKVAAAPSRIRKLGE